MNKDFIENIPLVPTVKNTVVKYQNTVLTVIMTAIVLLMSLAWNDVVQAVINKYYPKKDNSTIKGKLDYAVTVTAFVVLLQIFVFPHIEEFKN